MFNIIARREDLENRTNLNCSLLIQRKPKALAKAWILYFLKNFKLSVFLIIRPIAIATEMALIDRSLSFATARRSPLKSVCRDSLMGTSRHFAIDIIVALTASPNISRVARGVHRMTARREWPIKIETSCRRVTLTTTMILGKIATWTCRYIDRQTALLLGNCVNCRTYPIGIFPFPSYFPLITLRLSFRRRERRNCPKKRLTITALLAKSLIKILLKYNRNKVRSKIYPYLFAFIGENLQISTTYD